MENTSHGSVDSAVGIRPMSGTAALVLAVATLALGFGLFLLGWIPHDSRTLAAQSAADARVSQRPIVQVVQPRRAPDEYDLVLPGDVRGNQATALHARTNGYLKALPPGVDIGARVKAGQLLAELAAPELDADVERARAAVRQAEAAQKRASDDAAFQQTSFARYEGFAATGGLTKQQLEERRLALTQATTGLAVAEANVAAANGERARLEELQKFERIQAPFDGVITFRGYDAGATITAGGSGKELFRIVATDVMRVRVAVPLAASGSIRTGLRAELTVRGSAGRGFAGIVARTAGSIDPASRTMPVDVDVPNADGALLPGAYGNVRLHVVRGSPQWMLPTSAIAFGADGTRVAFVEGTRVRFASVSLGDDHGTEVEVLQGIAGNERLVDNPGGQLADGTEVEVQAAKEPAKPAEAPK